MFIKIFISRNFGCSELTTTMYSLKLKEIIREPFVDLDLHPLFGFGFPNASIFMNIKNYHVIVHKLAFNEFIETTHDSNSNIFTEFHCLKGNDHFHIFIKTREPLNVNINQHIQIELIKSDARSEAIKEIFIYGINVHDRFCNVTFGFPSLKTTCMKKILNSMIYSGNIDQLNLPKRLIDDLFQLNKTHYNMPEWNGKLVESVFIRELDSVRDKDFAVCFNNSKYHILDNRDWSFLIFNYFKIDNCRFYRVCLKCMNFEMKKDSRYQRIFELSSVYKTYWCWICKQVPLFQTLSRDEIFENHGIDIVTLKEQQILSPSMVIKVETFINGTKISTKLKGEKLYISEQFTIK